ncbi:MAG: hypothetical protein QNJ58_00695 [Desulfobacterales bacterium]|nr:hypothetical protein [Desulfobacterales bacterium]
MTTHVVRELWFPVNPVKLHETDNVVEESAGGRNGIQDIKFSYKGCVAWAWIASRMAVKLELFPDRHFMTLFPLYSGT